jgi:hypothetical protein
VISADEPFKWPQTQPGVKTGVRNSAVTRFGEAKRS